jgi:hypothetical protein
MNFSRPLNEIEASILDPVSLEWMERFRRCIALCGEYFEEAEKSKVGEIIFIR